MMTSLIRPSNQNKKRKKFRSTSPDGSAGLVCSSTAEDSDIWLPLGRPSVIPSSVFVALVTGIFGVRLR